MLELRDFQQETLNQLDGFLDALIKEQEEQDTYNEFLRQQGRDPRYEDVCAKAWRVTTNFPSDSYKTRLDGLGQSVPNICLKIPTGGGKTLLATHAVAHINQRLFKRNDGLVLWVMPSEAIYTQTRKNFKNYDHPYREVLDFAAPRRRAVILERFRPFKPADVTGNFAVMLLMLQAAGRESKEQLRMFRDHGGYMDFFPDPDNFPENNRLYKQIPNLDVHKDSGNIGGYRPLTIRYSLGNVLRSLRPIIVIDEGHKAYSDNARETLNGLNPRFILELSATPKRDRSNILVDVPGAALKDEQMIKLPIQLKNVSGGDWRTTLSDACERLKELDEKAYQLRGETGRTIRPILLVRVERTGSDQRERGFLHAEDAREYLVKELGMRPDEVRVKGGGKNEIADDDLLDETCPVRAIITKAALQEGWDCPFAYVLALLDKGTANTALTQMIGRVLRQPHAQATGIPDLDQAHVFCFDQNVTEAITKIRKGLQREGLGDLESDIVSGEERETVETIVERREPFRKRQIILPRVLHKNKRGLRPMDYEHDILSAIDWRKLKCGEQENLLEKDHEVTDAIVDDELEDTESHREALEGSVNAFFFARHLSDIIPNPWQAMRIAETAMPSFLKTAGSKQNLYNDRMNVVRRIREQIESQKDESAHRIFCKKLERKEIIFHLDAKQCGWEMPEKISMQTNEKFRRLVKKSNEQLELSFFDAYPESDFNSLEKNVAWYLDDREAVKWWHRIAARRDYNLQGWRKNRVYPDFIALIEKQGSTETFSIIETKGDHLAGNMDTNYKKRLFGLLEQAAKDTLAKDTLDVGSMEITKDDQKIILRIWLETRWKEDLARLAQSAA